MIANLINQVLQAMSKTLGNQEIERLKDVLEITFSNVEIFEKTESDAAIDMSVIKTFLSAKRVEGCSEKSMRYYESTIRNALATVGKNVKDVSTDDLRQYLDEYQQRSGASRVTVDNIRRILSSFFAWLEEEFYIVKSPVRRIHKVKAGIFAKKVQVTNQDKGKRIFFCHAFKIRIGSLMICGITDAAPVRM